MLKSLIIAFAICILSVSSFKFSAGSILKFSRRSDRINPMVLHSGLESTIVDGPDENVPQKIKLLLDPSENDVRNLINQLQYAHKSVEQNVEGFFSRYDAKMMDDTDLRTILTHLAQIPTLKCDKSHKMRHVVMVLFDILIYRPEMKAEDFGALLHDFAECLFKIPNKYPLNKLCYTLRRLLPDASDVELCLLELSRLGISRRNIPEDVLNIIGDKIAEMTNSCTSDKAAALLLALKQLGISMEDFDDDTYSHLIALYGKSSVSSVAVQ